MLGINGRPEIARRVLPRRLSLLPSPEVAHLPHCSLHLIFGDHARRETEHSVEFLKMDENRIKELEEKIAELTKRIPPHSVPAAMLEDLEDLEDELARAKEQQEKA
jgi:hypothetical protein